MGLCNIYHGRDDLESREDFERDQIKRWSANPFTLKNIEKAEMEEERRGHTDRGYRNNWEND